MKANIWFFVVLGLIYTALTCTPIIIKAVLLHLPLSMQTFVILDTINKILFQVINLVLSIGIIKIALAFCDQKKPKIGTLFDI